MTPVVAATDFPHTMSDGDIGVSVLEPADVDELFGALDDARVWEHIPRAVPRDADELAAMIRSWSDPEVRRTYTIRRRGEVVGMTSVIIDRDNPTIVEIGGTQISSSQWGSGLNAAVKRLLIAAAFDRGAASVRLRTDERNARSAAAIRKLGAIEVGVRLDHLVRRDGTRRRSIFFRIDRAAWVSASPIETTELR